MKRHIWAVSYTLLLFLFTTYLALDTFFISQIYSVVEEKQTENDNDASDTTGPQDGKETADAVISDRFYRDENITIAITEYREYGSTIYAADITLSSAEYLQTAFALNAYGKNVTEKTSEIAKNNGAILAINGDYYGVREKGFVVRGGILYRNTASRDQEDLVIYKDGSFAIFSENNTDAKLLVSSGAQQIFSFGPALAVDGTISVTEYDEVEKAMASNPRTAIGLSLIHIYDMIIGSLHFWYRDLFPSDMLAQEINTSVCYEHYWTAMKSAVATGGFDVLGHFDFPKRYYHQLLYDRETIYDIMKKAVDNGIVLEINTSSLRRECSETMPGDELICLYREAGGKYVTVGSDAHSAPELAADRTAAEKLIRRYGFQEVLFEMRQMHRI